jgi:hypothetical protein
MRKTKEITQAVLKEHLRYDPETGIFTWILPRARWGKPGDVAGCHGSHGSAIMIGLWGKRHYAHRLAWLYMTGRWPEGDIDHENGDPLDNRFANLRDVPHATNIQNQRWRHRSADQTLPFGVCKTTRSKRYFSRIRVNGSTKYLGCFKTPEEAHAAYVAAKRKYHNLPLGWEVVT